MKEYILTEYDTPFTALENVIGELIRCKDCKHRPYQDGCGNVVPVEKECSPCPCVVDDDWYYNYIPKGDWYCANGERKEE